MKKEHWTNTSENFLFAVSTDFVLQIKSLADSQKQLADRLILTKGRVSQTLNDPGNLTLKTMVKYARALGMKLSVVLYEDKDDPNNMDGPIHSDIFRLSWEKLGRPKDFWFFRKDRGAANSLGNYEGSGICLPEIAVSVPLSTADRHVSFELLEATGTT